MSFFDEKEFAAASKNAEVLLPTLKTAPHASAIIDGTLCQIDRRGFRSVECFPLGSAVAEFRQGPLCFYVREHSYGLLPGLANLYCLDANLHLRWIAAWPQSDDLCAEILGEENEILITRSVSGAIIRLDAHNGRLLSCVPSVAVAG